MTGDRQQRRRVWMHRCFAVVWLILGIVSFPLGWADSVVLVWIASVYANIAASIAAAAATDDRVVVDEIRELRREVQALRADR